MNVPRGNAMVRVGHRRERPPREPSEPGHGEEFSQVLGKAVNRKVVRGNCLGASPPTPQDLSLSCQDGGEQRERVFLAPSIPAPRSALRSHPCVALSSAPATGKFSLTSRKERQ
jgi:hypothetical protein